MFLLTNYIIFTLTVRDIIKEESIKKNLEREKDFSIESNVQKHTKKFVH